MMIQSKRLSKLWTMKMNWIYCLVIVAVTQIGSDGAAHLDFHCNESRTRLKQRSFAEPWGVCAIGCVIQMLNREVQKKFHVEISIRVPMRVMMLRSKYVWQLATKTAWIF
uniref:Uncharacterized protein n=1 Tax=Sphaerodactylus townsendi TaxID=933632 RepID=A0ACB8G0C6_9SAUR